MSLDTAQREQLFAVLKRHRHAFVAGPQDYRRTDWVRHRIHTTNSAPIRQAPRRLLVGLQDEARQTLADMLEQKVVSPSQSPSSSPVVLVQKRDGSVRYALTTKDKTLDTLSGTKWFSTLDLVSGYWQVEIEECDREKTAFCTSEGLY